MVPATLLLAFLGVAQAQRVRPTVTTACKVTATFTSTVLSTVTNVIVTSRCPRPSAQTIGIVKSSTVSNACASTTVFTTSTITSRVCQASSVITSTTSTSTSASPSPTIANPGFEDYGQSDPADSWALSGNAAPSTSRAHTGSWSVKMTLQQSSDTAALSQVIPGFTPSTPCQIQFWLIVAEFSSLRAGQPSLKYGGSTYYPVNSNWQQYSYTQNTDFLGQLPIRLDGAVYGGSGANFYIDDFTYTCS